MKILVAVDESSSFTDDEQWPYIKKIVNETVTALTKNAEVHLAKVTTELRFCTIDEYNEGWNLSDNMGSGLVEDLLNGLEYDKVLLITDGFINIKAFDDYVSVMILEDPVYVDNPQPIVGYQCEHCGKEKGLHQAKDSFCPEPKGFYSRVFKYSPNLSKPIRKFTI